MKDSHIKNSIEAVGLKFAYHLRNLFMKKSSSEYLYCNTYANDLDRRVIMLVKIHITLSNEIYPYLGDPNG